RYAALAGGVLMGLFAFGLTAGTGVKSALNYSVFTASAGAFALAMVRSYRWSLDALLARRAQQGAAIDEATLGPAPAEPNVRGRRIAEVAMSQENEKLVLEVFSVIERRDPERPDPRLLLDLCDPQIEFHWPASLPYGGTRRGFPPSGPSWDQVWGPLQPTQAERRMDPRAVASSGDEVVVLWRQRGVSRAGDR